MLIPVYLTVRDVMSPVVAMINHLQKCDDVGEITIVDCDSTYPPLLEWYATTCPIRVHRVANLGPRAAWDSGLIDQDRERGMLAGGFYCVSDSDLDLSQIPLDMLSRFCEGLQKNPKFVKAGPSLRIDDLPESAPHTQEVLSQEARHWNKPLSKHWYDSEIDTTLAVYRAEHGWMSYGPALRSYPPYTARHLSWYLDQANLTDEWKHYLCRLETKGMGLLWSPKIRNELTPHQPHYDEESTPDSLPDSSIDPSKRLATKWLCIGDHALAAGFCRILHERGTIAVASDSGASQKAMSKLCEWCEVIAVTSLDAMRAVPVEYREKVVSFDIGPSRWSSPTHPQLQTLLNLKIKAILNER